MQRPAKPSTPVRFRPQPPSSSPLASPPGERPETRPRHPCYGRPTKAAPSAPANGSHLVRALFCLPLARRDRPLPSWPRDLEQHRRWRVAPDGRQPWVASRPRAVHDLDRRAVHRPAAVGRAGSADRDQARRQRRPGSAITDHLVGIAPGSQRPPHPARVVKSVDTRDLKSLAARHAGSSPAPGTIAKQRPTGALPAQPPAVDPNLSPRTAAAR